MSKQDPADQVKFLVCCIGNTSNGRAVAKELDIVSKAAAQKRYERMLKAHGITTKGGVATNFSANNSENVLSTPTKRKARAEAGGSAKKKAKQEEDVSEEDTKPTPKARVIKPRGRKVKKEESSSDAGADESASPSSLTEASTSVGGESSDS